MTTKDAAKQLKVTPARVRAMIRSGRLKAKRFGSAWDISAAALKRVKNRKPGRPRNV